MAASTPPAGMFDGVYARGGVAAEVSGPAWLKAMLDVEAALAYACAAEGLVPDEAAAAIAEACRSGRFDVAELARAAADHATPVVPLVAALRSAVGEAHAEHVHCGATSQDILDTAAMLVARRSLVVLLDDAGAAAGAAARLARAHRGTPVVGRTLLQNALPVSFGLKAAGWSVGLDGAVARLRDVAEHELPVQMGGPVGSRDPAVAKWVADELGLAEPALPWHTVRLPVAWLAGGLGALAGVLGKVARDVVLLAQNEVGEASEGAAELARGGSTAMAHKRNPVAAVSVLACTRRVPGLVATLLAAMEQEHERAAGAWQAEWGAFSELLGLSGSACAWGRDLLENLQVDEARMGENLARLAAAGVREAQAPAEHLGAAGILIDRALRGVAR